MQNWLPVGVAAFVGGERERAKVADLVGDARVVTLTGTGGCGKTRLALEVAGEVASRAPSDLGGLVDHLNVLTVSERRRDDESGHSQFAYRRQARRDEDRECCWLTRCENASSAL